MVKELQYTSIRRVLDNLTEHPLLRDLTLEQAVRHAIRFISLHGYSKLYQDRIAEVEIHDFRGLLPCDLISIVQVKDTFTGICLRSMTDNFPMGLKGGKAPMPPKEGMSARKEEKPSGMRDTLEDNEWYIPKPPVPMEELAFKTQGRVIFTTFPEGCVEIAYKAIPVDDDGFPLLLDNETYLAALEAYIKKQVFTVKFDTGKIAAGVLQNAKQEYAMLAGELLEELNTPDVNEMESISRMMLAMVPRMREFDDGFKHAGDREYLRRH